MEVYGPYSGQCMTFMLGYHGLKILKNRIFSHCRLKTEGNAVIDSLEKRLEMDKVFFLC